MPTPPCPAATGRHPDSITRLGAALLGVGALGLVSTCACYVLAGPEAALPGGAATPAAAIAATPAAAGWMRAAGLAGMPSDVLLAAGALLLATHEHRRHAALALAGWLALAIASALFIVVDAMVAMVLPLAAAQPGGQAAYAGLRALFDVLFSIGAWTAAVGAVAAAWRSDGVLFTWPAAGWALRAAGAVGLVASTAHLLGGPGAALIGPGIAMLALGVLGAARAYATESGRSMESPTAAEPW